MVRVIRENRKNREIYRKESLTKKRGTKRKTTKKKSEGSWIPWRAAGCCYKLKKKSEKTISR